MDIAKKREEIRELIAKYLYYAAKTEWEYGGGREKPEWEFASDYVRNDWRNKEATEVIKELGELSVVIAVDEELPEPPLPQRVDKVPYDQAYFIGYRECQYLTKKAKFCKTHPLVSKEVSND